MEDYTLFEKKNGLLLFVENVKCHIQVTEECIVSSLDEIGLFFY